MTVVVQLSMYAYNRWWDDPVSALDLKPSKVLLPTNTCIEAVSIMKESHLSDIPIIKEKYALNNR